MRRLLAALALAALPPAAEARDRMASTWDWNTSHRDE
jgi:hypothetical protein